MDNIKIEYMPIKALSPYENNARKHAEIDVDAIAASIKEFGFDDPIGVWGEKNIIVEGHGRLLAAKKLKMEEVPCIRLDHLTDEQRRAYTLTHNKTAELSLWDTDLLISELDDITDIDMGLFGFDFGDYEEEETGDVAEDEMPDIPEEPISKPGDLYQLGEHRLICGDCGDVNVLERLLEGQRAILLLTDPPYGINKDKGIKTTYGDSAHNAYEYNGDWDSNTPEQDVFDYLRTITDNQIIFGGNYFTDKLPVGTSWIVWDKVGEIKFNNPFSDCELAWTSYTKVITKKYTVLQQGFVADEKEKRVHPTQKPVVLMANILIDHTEKGDIILDTFGGSGSTLIACEQTGRKCYMCEMDPRYVSVILERYINFVGSDKDVFLIEDGKKIPYAEVIENR